MGIIENEEAASVLAAVRSLSHAQHCDPTDCSPPGSSIHGIFMQVSVLEELLRALLHLQK